MNIRLSTFIVIIGILTACSNGTNDTKQRPVTSSTESASFILANNFSDSEWKNGVLQKDGQSNVFYFLKKSGDLPSLKVGDTLGLAKTGNVVVRKIAASAPNGNGIISVFVTIDKEIDPIGDGYPNKILVPSKAIQAP